MLKSVIKLAAIGVAAAAITASAAAVSADSTAFDATPLVVTTTNDTGPGSLREAILDANRNAGSADSISFDIPSGGVQRIMLQTPLPTVSDGVTIDARTQPGYAGTPLVEVDGQAAPAGIGIDAK